MFSLAPSFDWAICAELNHDAIPHEKAHSRSNKSLSVFASSLKNMLWKSSTIRERAFNEITQQNHETVRKRIPLKTKK